MKRILCALIGTVLLPTALAAAAEPPTPQAPPLPPAAVAGAAQTKLDLNRATVSELIAVPGIGPRTAQAIVEMRAKKGSYSKLEELIEVKGIGQKKLAKLSAYLVVNQPAPAAPSAGATR